jgi:hypothetical protein
MSSENRLLLSFMGFDCFAFRQNLPINVYISAISANFKDFFFHISALQDKTEEHAGGTPRHARRK